MTTTSDLLERLRAAAVPGQEVSPGARWRAAGGLDSSGRVAAREHVEVLDRAALVDQLRQRVTVTGGFDAMVPRGPEVALPPSPGRIAGLVEVVPIGENERIIVDPALTQVLLGGGAPYGTPAPEVNIGAGFGAAEILTPKPFGPMIPVAAGILSSPGVAENVIDNLVR